MGSNGASTKVVIITAIISAVASVLVAFIGIVPVFYERKTTTTKEQETCTITGTITTVENMPLTNTEIYLIPATGKEYFASTDVQGEFIFQGLPDDTYWVVVRDNVSKKASRVLIKDTEISGEIEVVESVLKFERCKK